MTFTNSRRRLSASLFLPAAMLLAFTAHAQTAKQLTPNLISEFKWRLVGPSSPAGRVWQVVGDENNPKTFYVCTAGGGLWKSTDNGTTLVPIFDNQTSASTGAVAIAKSNSNIVWVGTGEPANTRANSWGEGNGWRNGYHALRRVPKEVKGLNVTKSYDDGSEIPGSPGS